MSIEQSSLSKLIKQTFSEISLPPNVDGSIKLYQHRTNPDLFDLYYYSAVNSEAYQVGGTYTAADIATFERADFEDFPENESEPVRGYTNSRGDL